MYIQKPSSNCSVRTRRVARVDEWNGFENRRRIVPSVGSNPTSSAKYYNSVRYRQSIAYIVRSILDYAIITDAEK